MPREQYNQILDASTTVCVHKTKTQQQILTTPLGGNVVTTLKDIAQQQLAKMMIAHLYH